MAVTTVRPNATASGSGSFTLSGGGATVHETLNDDDDLTFLQKTSSVVGQASAIVDFGTTTISASRESEASSYSGKMRYPNKRRSA
jgi:hypothetical protein